MDSVRPEPFVQPSRRRRAVRIRFLVSGGARVGLGHVMRTAVLAAEARRQGHGVTMVVRGDAAAHAALAAELPGAPMETWRDPAVAVSTGGPILIDSPEDISAELSAARQRGVRSVVIDRTDHLDHADATVLPVLHGPAIAHPRLFQGAEFLAIAPVVRSAEVPAYPAGRSIALVTAGGADPVGLSTPLTEALLTALGDRDVLPVHVVVGPAFARGDALVRQLTQASAYVHRALPRARLVELMAQARFALTGFGTTVYDLAVLGTPVVYWTHRSADLEGARRLEARGLGACGGDGTTITPGDLAAVLARTVLRESWCIEASARGRGLVAPANGASAVVRLLAGDEPERS
jgi:spore coat polysaccharide biosynthesis predicted glycosyltransferase SpsG